MCWNINDSCSNCDKFCINDEYYCIICYDIFCKQCYDKINFCNRNGNKICNYCVDNE